MTKTLEKYQRCSYGALETNLLTSDAQSSYQEYLKLKGKVEVLQQTQRHFLGEDLGQLCTEELQHLERQLESSLKQIRSTRTQYVLDQLADLQQKEQALLETNKALRNKLEEIITPLQLSWEAGVPSTQYRYHPAEPGSFFEPLEVNNTLQIGYNPVVTDQLNIGTSTQNANGIVPGWML
ncbi:unnamed protein product [Ilex paraguariensis]|uniref:K-box domain-containing protein n=1 Tax=Ilex paraguariensis TaxID=185542 RepID=A0ABC8UYQ2_9AQUA